MREARFLHFSSDTKKHEAVFGKLPCKSDIEEVLLAMTICGLDGRMKAVV